MKTKIYRFLVLLIVPVIYIVMVSGFHRAEGTTGGLNVTTPPSVSVPKNFMNFILNVDYQYGNDVDECNSHPSQMENHVSEYADLNFNGTALYDADSGSYCLGNFNAGLLPGQKSKTEALIDSVHQDGLKAIFERSNISNLCYAQRLVYEVSNGGSQTVNDGFCYQVCRGHYEVEQDGTTAIHACANPQQCNEENWDGMAQNICESIYENLQHTDLPGFRPQARDVWEWHLKPRMKIKQEDFNDPNKQTLPVVTIKVYCFGDPDTPIAEKTIKVRNFKNDTGYYNGLYQETFNFIDDPGTDLWVPGDETNGLNKGRNDKWWEWDDPNSSNRCQVDFKIHWEGNVDVWFDKLTVDDYRANKLFDPDRLKNYDPYLDSELTAFGSSSNHKIDIFFVDETVHSNIPCIKYVTDYIRQHSPGTIISCATSNYLNIHGLKNDDLGFRPFLDSVKPDYFSTDVHNFVGSRDELYPYDYNENYLPSSITVTDNLVPSGTSPAGWLTDYNTYNNWLQNKVLGDKSNTENSFVWVVNLARTQTNTYSPGTRLIVQPQIHGDLRDHEDIGTTEAYDEGGREPLDEEIQAQAMIAIAHGADGICWYELN